MSDLIDTTEMYLKTIVELLEEGAVPLRARIAERLGQSGPTVSQTVARMERDGLLVVQPDRRLDLTERGLDLGTRVMRKHRLVERLLTDVIGLDWELVHAEACRWEHVISLDVEKRLIAILDTPTVSPYGNPIPGLKDLGVDIEHTPFRQGAAPLADVATDEPRTFTLRRMSENIQADLESLRALDEVGLRPGTEFEAVKEQGGVRIAVGEKSLGLGLFAAELLFVDADV